MGGFLPYAFSIAHCPRWCYGADIIVDTASALVLLAIAYTSIRYYFTIPVEKRYAWFGTAYFLLALAFIAKVWVQYELRSLSLALSHGGLVLINIDALQNLQTLFTLAFYTWTLFTLAGLYILFVLTHDELPASVHILVISLTVVLTFLVAPYAQVYHAVALLFFCVLAIQYLRRSQQNKNKNTALVGRAFLVLTLTELFFILSTARGILYFIAESVQLIAFGMILIAYLRTQHGQKTLKHRHSA